MPWSDELTVFSQAVQLINCCTMMDTERICFAVFIYIFHILQIWQKFSFHSCLQLPGDGANWTKTVFHCGLTGSCESIYSLTAMRQNGPWEIGTGRGLRKWERAHLVPSRHIFNMSDWIPSCVFPSKYAEQCVDADPCAHLDVVSPFLQPSLDFLDYCDMCQSHIF